MRRTFPRLSILLLLAGLLAPRAAGAAIPTVRVALDAPRSLDASEWPVGRKLLELPPISLAEGESRLIYGRLTALNEATRTAEQQIGVGCDGIEGGTMRTSRNNEGSDRRYPLGYGKLTIDVRYLYTARATGTFVCSMWAKSSGNTLTALAGTTNTFVDASDPAVGASQWGLDEPCDSSGTVSATPDYPYDSECRYVVPRAAGQSSYPWKLTALVMPTFVADPSATSVTANADLQLTTCYRATSSCIDQVDRFGGRNGSVAVVDSKLEVIQLDADGGLAGCGVRGQTPAIGAGNSPDGNYMRSTISRDAHHLKLRYQLRFPISVNEGCTRNFTIRVVVRAMAGDPVKIAGSRLNSRGGVRLAFSNGIARNAFS